MTTTPATTPKLTARNLDDAYPFSCDLDAYLWHRHTTPRTPCSFRPRSMSLTARTAPGPLVTFVPNEYPARITARESIALDLDAADRHARIVHTTAAHVRDALAEGAAYRTATTTEGPDMTTTTTDLGARCRCGHLAADHTPTGCGVTLGGIPAAAIAGSGYTGCPCPLTGTEATGSDTDLSIADALAEVLRRDGRTATFTPTGGGVWGILTDTERGPYLVGGFAEDGWPLDPDLLVGPDDTDSGHEPEPVTVEYDDETGTFPVDPWEVAEQIADVLRPIY